MKTKLLAVALLAISCHANAEAEKFCKTSEIDRELFNKYSYSADKMEEAVRKKCKAGDVILIMDIRRSGGEEMSARLCDFKFHIDERVCILAPPRETY